MTFGTKRKVKTRSAPKSHEKWIPWDYQRRAVDHLLENNIAALFLDPGLGKTSIVLEAFRQLKRRSMAKKVLVVAPLRVCQLVWRQEGSRWTQFRGLTFSLVHGTQKQRIAALEEDADIYLINPEGIAWLSGQYTPRTFPFDTVVIDELTKFKNARSKRHKKLRPLLRHVRRRWGLTGTPAPNGLMDLFGQMLLLDDGKALGVYITHFRDRYFVQGFTGFDYTLRPGADKEISEKIAPYVLRMKAEDYIQLPQLINDTRIIQLPPGIKKAYAELKREMLVDLEGETVMASNAGAVYSKLKQLSNGAVYVEATPDKPRHHVDLHTLKLDALEELIEELQGQPLLVAYEFRHDLKRITERLGYDVPNLGHGVSTKRAEQIEADWNAGKIPVLLAHPASAGHGLNFQRGGACHLCWFSVTIDLELYDQFMRRLYRQGNTSEHVINHALVVDTPVDEQSLDILDGKAVTQARLLESLNAELGSSTKSEGEDDMVRKLRRKSEVEQTEEERPKRKLRRRAAEEDEDEEDEDDEDEAPRRRGSSDTQRKKVSRRLRGKDSDEEDDGDTEDEDDSEDDEEDEAPRRGRKAFSKRVQDKLADDDEPADEEDSEDDEPPAEKPKRRKRRAASSEGSAEESESSGTPPFDSAPCGVVAEEPSEDEQARWRRQTALGYAIEVAGNIGLTSEAQLLKAAKTFEDYITGGK